MDFFLYFSSRSISSKSLFIFGTFELASASKSSPCASFLLKCIVKNPLTQVVWWAAVGRTKGGVSFSFHCSESRANEIHSINSNHASHEILEFLSLSLSSDDEDLILPIYLQSWLLFPKAHSEKYVCSIYVFRFPSYISALFSTPLTKSW